MGVISAFVEERSMQATGVSQPAMVCLGLRKGLRICSVQPKEYIYSVLFLGILLGFTKQIR
jgi:hypothetical protein